MRLNSSVSSLTVETLLKTPTIPEIIRAMFLKSVGQMRTNEEVMWREVAARLTLDAFGVTPEATRVFDGMDAIKFNRYRDVVKSARRWFTKRQNADDVAEVFGCWNGDAELVLREVAALPPLQIPQFKKAA